MTVRVSIPLNVQQLLAEEFESISARVGAAYDEQTEKAKAELAAIKTPEQIVAHYKAKAEEVRRAWIEFESLLAQLEGGVMAMPASPMMHAMRRESFDRGSNALAHALLYVSSVTFTADSIKIDPDTGAPPAEYG